MIFIKKNEKTILRKEFEEESWLMCISKTKKMIDKYNLELINLNLIKINDGYKCIVDYGLGVKR